uniref:Uncharacterized protein n=1 Tax=Anguilla anguilla TaxID=7936 RepID=A0A0E9X645_ANGAN
MRVCGVELSALKLKMLSLCLCKNVLFNKRVECYGEKKQTKKKNCRFHEKVTSSVYTSTSTEMFI